MNYQNRFEKQITYSIEYYDLDKLIEQVYGVPFESILDQANGSVLSINVDGKLDEYDKTCLDLFINSGVQEYNTIRLLFNDMCQQGLIEPGKYLINISW